MAYVRSVILPCAGQGSRLGLPYPKELHFPLPGKALIDFSLERVFVLSGELCVNVVLRSGKELIQSYLVSRWPEMNFCFITQEEPEFLGALRSAMKHVAQFNFLLLPDQYIVENGVIEGLFKKLEDSEEIVVMAYKTDSQKLISEEGALNVIDGRLKGIAEKPGIEFASEFNAVWCGIGFRSSAVENLLSSLEQLYASGFYSNEQWAVSPLNGIVVDYVEDYMDLGDWSRMTDFQKRYLK